MITLPLSVPPTPTPINHSINPLSRHHLRPIRIASLTVHPALVILALLTFFVPQLRSQMRWETPNSVRTPLGVYAHIDIENALAKYNGPVPTNPAERLRVYRAYLDPIYEKLLANPAISGLIVGQHWDHIQPDDPACVFSNSCVDGPGGYDWAFIDDAFTAANAAHKSIQLLIIPGVVSPTWLMDKLPSCDGLFTTGSAPFDCGKVTFDNFPEQSHADALDPPLPLPWNFVYIAYWDDFLFHLRERYSSNPAFTSIAMAGPNCGSSEIIFPTSQNHSIQVSGMSADPAWQILIHHSFPFLPGYENSDQVFIDTWKQAIDAYEFIFSGVTLILTPDDGAALPDQPFPTPSHPDNFLYGVDCSTSKLPMSCEAKTEILSYFARAKGRNQKATMVGGMSAQSNTETGDIGVPGIKVLTGYTPPLHPQFLGGAEFDFQATLLIQRQGCARYPIDCKYLTPEQGTFNTLTVFFDGTPDWSDWAGTVSGFAPMQFVSVSYGDVLYAEDPANACQTFLPSMNLGPPSMQDIYSLASYDLYVMNGKPAVLPPTTCN